MDDPRPTIFVVDDDPSVCDAISNLLEAVGMQTRVFGSTEEFQRAIRPDVPSCLVLDMKLPGMSGLQLQESLEHAGIRIPIVFITAFADVPMTSKAMKAGAIEFLVKPFQKQELLTAIQEGLERDRAWREEQTEIAELRAKFEELTAREREVMELVAAGLINKQVGVQLGLSEVTVKIHRGRVMQKMGAASLADLVRMSDKLKPKASK
jgi:FixJ family two-component response regulator